MEYPLSGGVCLRSWRIVIGKRPLAGLAVISILALVALCVGVLVGVKTCSVSVSAWDRQISLSTRADTVADVLVGLNISLSPGDVVDPSPETAIADGLEIEIERARPVFIHWSGKSLPVFTAENRVSKILSMAHVEKEANDVVYPGLEEELTEDCIIRVARVTYGEVEEREEIPYDTQKREDGSLEAGLTRVYNQGVTGLIQVLYRVRYEDGKEVSREEKSRAKIRDMSPLILLVGSMQQVSRGGHDIRFERALEVTATAYCPCTKCCGLTAAGTTCTGVPATKGVIAVDPRVIPLGTRVYVDGYGYALAADVGSAIKGSKIDVCFDTHEQALAWGLKKTKVYMLRQ